MSRDDRLEFLSSQGSWVVRRFAEGFAQAMNGSRFVCLCVWLAGSSAVFAAADMNKQLRSYMETAETGFDPAQFSDHYSLEIIHAILEPLLGYDYLARPLKLTANTAIDLPQISEGGRTYIFKLKPGIYFAHDAAFKGRKRELTAQDYVYSLKRLVDPNGKAPWDFMLKGKVIGLDEKIAAAKKNGKFDYDSPVAGLEAVDRYTLKIRLIRPDYNLPYILAAPATGAVAREVVEHYGKDIDAHPVGTGPYRLRSWQRQSRIILEANPDFRGVRYTPSRDAQGIPPDVAEELAGKTFPRIGVIDIRIIESPQASWLSFLQGELDIHPRVSAEFARIAAPAGVLDAKLAQRGVRYFHEPESDITYSQFNMDDPVVGGYTPERIALRRALAMSYNQLKEISIIRNGMAVAAQSPIAPGVTGYDPNFKNTLVGYSPARAKALLDTFGYEDCDSDGWRERPGCLPLVITYLSSTGSASRDFNELMVKGATAIGIRLRIEQLLFSDLVKARGSGTYQMSGSAWGADYPDAENFMQLLYGPNSGPGNESRFKLPEFDRLYLEIASMPDSAARNAKLQRMSRLVAAYGPWIFHAHRVRTHMAQSWVSGFKPHADHFQKYMYYDIDMAQRDAFLKTR